MRRKKANPKKGERGPRGLHVGVGLNGPIFQVCLGDAIVKARVRAGLLQEELAEKMGVTQGAWSRVERGSSAMRVETLVSVGHVLGVDPLELLGLALELDRKAREPMRVIG